MIRTRKLGGMLIIATLVIALLTAFDAPVSAAVKAPAKVGGVKVTKATNVSIALKWNKAARAKSYQVFFKKSTAKKWSKKTVKTKTITLSKLVQNSTYKIKVRGMNGKKAGKYSAVVTQKTYATPGTVNVKTMFAKTRLKNNIVIQWGNVKNVSLYEIDVYKMDGTSFGIQQSTTNLYETVYSFKPNTWYGFKVRAVNTKTGKFPAVKGPWSAMFYTCTTFGDRVITGTLNSDGTKRYQMEGTTPFRIGEDESLIPTGYFDVSDEYGPNYDYDSMACNAVSFPADFDAEGADAFKGKTIKIGDTLDGKTVSNLEVNQEFGEDGPTGNCEVTIKCDGAIVHCFRW